MYITEQNMNNDPDLISVVIPVYKVEKYLNECVQSVLLQTYENLQVILVDDGSPDRCGEMCAFPLSSGRQHMGSVVCRWEVVFFAKAYQLGHDTCPHPKSCTDQ